MMAVSRSIQFDSSFEGIHFHFIQFLYLYVHIPRSSCYEVSFGQYHMIFIDLDVDEIFFHIATFPNKNGMLDSLSSLLIFITTICPTFTSIYRSNTRNTSLRSLFIEMMCSVVIGLCFFAGLDVVVCGFPRHGPKYPFCNIGGR